MKTLSFAESMKIARKHGIKFAKTAEAETEQELRKACKKTGFPLVMKIISSGISHKTDVGGVKIGIQNIEEARKAFAEMKKLEGFEGAAVQEMLRGTELIIGGKRDVQFGPAVLFGLGGIYTEIFKDTCLRICPIDKKTAIEMVRSIKAYPIIAGARGGQPANMEALVNAIIGASRLMMNEKGVVEMDLNPLIAAKGKILAVDARVVVEE